MVSQSSRSRWRGVQERESGHVHRADRVLLAEEAAAAAVLWLLRAELLGAYPWDEMSTPEPEPALVEHKKLPVEELLRRARPLPPYGEMVIEELDPADADAFLAAVLS